MVVPWSNGYAVKRGKARGFSRFLVYMILTIFHDGPHTACLGAAFAAFERAF